MIHKSCALLRKTICIAFSKKHSFAEIHECKLTEIHRTSGFVCQHAKGVFWCFGCFSLFLFFLGRKKSQKAIFRSFRGFPLCSSKRPVFKSFCSSHPFFLVFLCLPFQNSIFFLGLLSINPFLESFLFLGFFSLSVLAFPLLMFAGFFEINFPNIPWFKPNLLSSLAVSLFVFFFLLFSVAFVLVFLFFVSAFLFYVGFVLVCYFLYFLFCFQIVKKSCFPAILVFCESCWLEGSLFLCFMFLF